MRALKALVYGVMRYPKLATDLFGGSKLKDELKNSDLTLCQALDCMERIIG